MCIYYSHFVPVHTMSDAESDSDSMHESDNPSESDEEESNTTEITFFRRKEDGIGEGWHDGVQDLFNNANLRGRRTLWNPAWIEYEVLTEDFEATKKLFRERKYAMEHNGVAV